MDVEETKTLTPPDPLQQQPPLPNPMRPIWEARLMRYYQHYNPTLANLEHIEPVLDSAEAHPPNGFETIWNRLTEKYGPEPIGEIPATLPEALRQQHAVNLVGATPEEVRQYWERRLMRYYLHHNPSMATMEKIEPVLDSCEAHPPDGYVIMWTRLINKYGPEPPQSCDVAVGTDWMLQSSRGRAGSPSGVIELPEFDEVDRTDTTATSVSERIEQQQAVVPDTPWGRSQLRLAQLEAEHKKKRKQLWSDMVNQHQSSPSRTFSEERYEDYVASHVQPHSGSWHPPMNQQQHDEAVQYMNIDRLRRCQYLQNQITEMQRAIEIRSKRMEHQFSPSPVLFHHQEGPMTISAMKRNHYHPMVFSPPKYVSAFNQRTPEGVLYSPSTK